MSILKISLSLRVSLILAALVGVVLGGGAFTLWYAAKLDRLFVSVTDRDLAPLEASLRLENALALQKGYVVSYLFDGQEHWLTDLNDREKAFDHWLAQARETTDSPQARSLVNRIESEYLRYVDLRRRAVEDYLAGRREEGAARHAQARGKFTVVIGLCEDFQAIFKDDIRRAQEEGRERLGGLHAAMFAVMPLSLLLAGLLSLVLLRQILGPVRRLAYGDQAASGRPGASPGNEVEALDRRVQSLISHADQARHKLEESRERVVQQEKLAMVGKMAAGVAHSVRNPLTSVKMRLFSLTRSLALTPVQREDFDVISEEIRHIDSILQNFLEYSRPPKLRKQQVSPSDVVDMALQLMRHRLESYRVEVELVRDEPLEPMMLDPEQIKECLVNLLVNACEAMPGGGRIVVSEERGKILPLGDVAVLKLADTGPGVPPEVGERIFQPFFSTKEEGSGLGLAIAKRVIEEHDGHLILGSAEGKGAVFTITLPYGREGRSHPQMRP